MKIRGQSNICITWISTFHSLKKKSKTQNSATHWRDWLKKTFFD
jgi:hypothetical protein